MVWLLGGIVIILLIKVVVDTKRILVINDQLYSVLHRKSQALIKTYGTDRYGDELVNKINQLILLVSETQAEYQRIDQHNREMIASIAHDFRTPLTSMLGYVQILGTTQDPQTQKRYLDIIEARVISLSVLIEDFYTISIMASNDYPVRYSTVNPSVVLQNQLALYYEELKHAFNDVSIDIDETILTLFSDENILNRIIGNLIKNALVHGQGDFKVKTLCQNHRLNIMITNHTDPKLSLDADQVFKRTVSVTGHQNTHSTGLGLAIAKDLAQLIDAELSAQVENETITFMLSIAL